MSYIGYDTKLIQKWFEFRIFLLQDFILPRLKNFYVHIHPGKTVGFMPFSNGLFCMHSYAWKHM